MNVIFYLVVPIVWAQSFDYNIVLNPGAETGTSFWTTSGADVTSESAINKQGANLFCGGTQSQRQP